MTPFEFQCAVNGKTKYRQQRDCWLAWHIAALGRTKRMPKLQAFMPRKDPKDLSRQILSSMQAFNLRRRATNMGSGNRGDLRRRAKPDAGASEQVRQAQDNLRKQQLPTRSVG